MSRNEKMIHNQTCWEMLFLRLWWLVESSFANVPRFLGFLDHKRVQYHDCVKHAYEQCGSVLTGVSQSLSEGHWSDRKYNSFHWFIVCCSFHSTWELITGMSEVCREALHLGACEACVTFLQFWSKFFSYTKGMADSKQFKLRCKRPWLVKAIEGVCWIRP